MQDQDKGKPCESEKKCEQKSGQNTENAEEKKEDKSKSNEIPCRFGFVPYMAVNLLLRISSKRSEEFIVKSLAFLEKKHEDGIFYDDEDTSKEAIEYRKHLEIAKQGIKIMEDSDKIMPIDLAFIKELHTTTDGTSLKNLIKVLESFKYLSNLNDIAKIEESVSESLHSSSFFGRKSDTLDIVLSSDTPPPSDELPGLYMEAMRIHMAGIIETIRKKEPIPENIFDYERVLEDFEFDEYSSEKQRELLTEIHGIWKECYEAAKEEYEKEYLLPYEGYRKHDKGEGIPEEYFASKPYPDYKKKSFNAVIMENMEIHKRFGAEMTKVLVDEGTETIDLLEEGNRYIPGERIDAIERVFLEGKKFLQEIEDRNEESLDEEMFEEFGEMIAADVKFLEEPCPKNIKEKEKQSSQEVEEKRTL